VTDLVPAHQQAESHRYLMHFPPHAARESDPHHADFDHFHRRTRAAARCWIGERIGFQDCRDAQGHPASAPEHGEQPGLELHHAHIEFSLQNGVDLAALEKDYPGVSDPSQVGAWVQGSADNLRWLCAWHHRGAAGAHTAAHADWEASAYVRALIGEAPK
jgi:hypothetical protein